MTRGEFTPAAAEQEQKRLSQREAIMRALRLYPEGVTRGEIMSVGGDRFSARINELREDGHRILGPVMVKRWGLERTEPLHGEDRYKLEVKP